VAELKLAALGVQIDTLDNAQQRYQQAWQIGTT
jgi:S-adenosylhomocysteine hydrolase